MAFTSAVTRPATCPCWRWTSNFLNSVALGAVILLALTSNSSFGFNVAPTLSTSQIRKAFGTTTRSSSNARKTWLEMKKVGGGKKKSKGKASPAGFAGAFRGLQNKGFPYAGSIRPGKQSRQKVVMDPNVKSKPDYWQNSVPGAKRPMLPWQIEVKTPEEIEKMRASGLLARKILDLGGRAVAPGVTTDDIDNIVHEAVVEAGAYPSPLNYHGFPKSCCTSVNEVICHGIPDDRKLEAGDIINLDITVYLDGYHGDCSEMFVVGGREALDDDGAKLIQTTYDSWLKACEFVQKGRHYKDIGAIIEDHIVDQGFSTVRNFCGHGIGSTFHTNPSILHYRNTEPQGQMAPGHTFTIEPMICEGTAKPLNWPDKWTATTADGGRSAQFEHTLLITEGGVEALTGKTLDSPVQWWERESEVHKGIWLGTSKAAVARQNEINAVNLKEMQR